MLKSIICSPEIFTFRMCCQFLSVISATTSMFLLELHQLAIDDGLDGLTNGRDIPAEIDLDADLVEAHQRPEAHASGNELIDPFFGQILDRRHATALLMRHIGNDIHLTNLLVFN